jgi:hypothetical protein
LSGLCDRVCGMFRCHSNCGCCCEASCGCEQSCGCEKSSCGCGK